MRGLALALAALLASTGAQAASQVYNGPNGHWQARNWKEAVMKLPCVAFIKEADGTWTMPGIIELPHHEEISNLNFGPNYDTDALNKRCNITH